MTETPPTQPFIYGKDCIPILKGMATENLSRKEQAEKLNELGCRSPSGLLWTRNLLMLLIRKLKLKVPCRKHYVNPNYKQDSIHGDSCLPVLKELIAEGICSRPLLAKKIKNRVRRARF